VAFAALAGVSFGVAALVRPTNLVLIVPALVAMPIAARTCGAFAAGALPCAIVLAIYQRWAYGHALESGYGDLSSTFTLGVIGRSLAHYARWLPRLASWLVVVAPVALWSARFAQWRLIVAAWVLVIFGVYAAYPVTSEAWWTIRFALPAFPPLIIASMAGLREIASRIPNARLEPVEGRAISRAPAQARRSQVIIAIASAVVIALVGLAMLSSPQFEEHRRMKDGERIYQDALTVMAADPSLSSAVLMVQMTGAANYHAPDLRFIRYDEVSPAAWTALRRWQSTTDTPIGAALFPFEREEIFGRGVQRFPCNWQSRGAYLYVTFWVCPP